MFRKFALILLFVTISKSNFASHIVGGDFTNRWIGGNNFELTLKIYRDSLNGLAPFDATIVIGIFDKVTNLRTDTLVMTLFSAVTVTLSGPASSCVSPPEVVVEIGTYIDTISIPDNPNGYYIVWERCCRNSSILNIQLPNQTGLTFYQEMPDPALQNSSPYFPYDPLPFLCVDQPVQFSFGAVDPDGDSLVYELVDPMAGNSGYPTGAPQAILPTPLPGPYVSVLWTPGYSLANVCGGPVPLTVNPVNGDISVLVDITGLFAMAVAVHEFRNGVEIGLIRREIEFTVIVCPNDPVLVTASIPAGTSSSTVTFNGARSFTAYESDTICFLVRAMDNVDSVFLSVAGEVFAGGGITPPFATANSSSGLNLATSNFCWQTVCGQARATPYKVVYTSVDNGCPLPTTTVDTFYITLKEVPVINSLHILCIGLKDSNTAEVFWVDTNTVPSKFFEYYEIYRSENGSPFSLLNVISDQSVGSYEDVSAYDYFNNDYCYYIRAKNSCGEYGPASDTLCTITQFNTKTVYIKQVSVIDSGKIELQWKHFPDGPYSTFFVYRKENSSGSPFALREILTYPNYDSWIDNDVATSDKSYCYQVVNEDYCGNRSLAGNDGCSIYLTGIAQPFINNLNWTPYADWNGGVRNYELFRNSNLNPVFSSLSLFADTSQSFRDFELNPDAGYFSYYVKAVEGSGSLDAISISNEITLEQAPVGFLPLAFTPNKDGKNDYFGIESSYVKTFEIEIFNRWGNLVYSSSNKNEQWNGNYRDKPAPQGTYIYVAKYSGYDDAPFTRTGTVTLIR